MEFMFDDEVDEVGAELEAFCPKCKTDTSHVVITKYEEEIRRVQCSPCGDVHAFRRPRGEAEDEVPEPLSAKKRALLKKPTWEEGMVRYAKAPKGKAPRTSKPYSFRATYQSGDLVSHPRFGDGFVSEVLAENKVEITFKEGRRILVHNRSDLAPTMLMASPEGPEGIDSDGEKSSGKRHLRGGKNRDRARTAAEPRPAKGPAKPVAAATVKPAARPAIKPIARPAVRSAARPAVKAAAKPVAKKPVTARPDKKARPAATAKRKAVPMLRGKKKAAATAAKKPTARRGAASRPLRKLKKSR